MHIALVDGVRTQPSPGLAGRCAVCDRDMVARCGEIRVHHWAHRGRRVCDHWWEPETEWHRAWKNRFDIAWHENIRHAEDGEKHIADIRTSHDLVIEFQHSAMGAEERAAREAFYGNMVWVVDGTRLLRDFPRFEKARHFFDNTSHEAIFLVKRPETTFPKQWLASSVPVFFDFKGAGAEDGHASVREWLWCLLPGRAEGRAVVAAMSRETFVAGANSGPTLVASAAVIDSLAKSLRINDEIMARRAYIGRTRYVLPSRIRLGGRRRRF
jgi:competence protein CoiA